MLPGNLHHTYCQEKFITLLYLSEFSIVLVEMFQVKIFLYIFLGLSSTDQQKLGCLSFSNKLRSSSIFKRIEIVFHISSSLVEIMLHTKNHLPRLPRAKLRLSSIYKKIRLWRDGKKMAYYVTFSAFYNRIIS